MVGLFIMSRAPRTSMIEVISCLLLLCATPILGNFLYDDLDDSQRYQPDYPQIHPDHEVAFYYLETSLPFNTPKRIKDAAESSFLQHHLSHAGLGIWDRDEDTRFTIEWVAENFTNGLFPTIEMSEEDPKDGYIRWRNHGQIVVTNPLNEDDWIESRLITTSNGIVYESLIRFLELNILEYETYQPVSVIYPDADMTTHDIDGSPGFKTIITAFNSYTFAFKAFYQLAHYGCKLETFTDVSASSFDYIAANLSVPVLVAWEEGEFANRTVIQWYKDLEICYETLLETVEKYKLGGAVYVNLIKQCYEMKPYAFVFENSNTVWEISLANNSRASPYATPKLYRYPVDLPDKEVDKAQSLDPIDWAFISCVFFGLLAAFAYLLCKIKAKSMLEAEKKKGADAVRIPSVLRDSIDRARSSGSIM